jgi:hypothetical protein
VTARRRVRRTPGMAESPFAIPVEIEGEVELAA